MYRASDVWSDSTAWLRKGGKNCYTPGAEGVYISLSLPGQFEVNGIEAGSNYTLGVPGEVIPASLCTSKHTVE